MNDSSSSSLYRFTLTLHTQQQRQLRSARATHTPRNVTLQKKRGRKNRDDWRPRGRDSRKHERRTVCCVLTFLPKVKERILCTPSFSACKTEKGGPSPRRDRRRQSTKKRGSEGRREERRKREKRRRLTTFPSLSHRAPSLLFARPGPSASPAREMAIKVLSPGPK